MSEATKTTGTGSTLGEGYYLREIATRLACAALSGGRHPEPKLAEDCAAMARGLVALYRPESP